MANPKKKVLVLGGGIAGLTAANALRERGIAVLLIEKSPRCGGAVRTVERDGFLSEGGPQTFLVEDKILCEFLRETGALDRAIDASPSVKKRFIVRGGKPLAVPMSLSAAISTPLFSFFGKLRLLGEIFVPAAGRDVAESVADFVRRRVGEEFYDYALNPLTAGIFAGDPEKLAVRYAFPKVWNLEQRYGSLIRGTIPNARAKRESGRFEKKRTLSFPHGMETLPKLLRARLDPTAVRTNSELTDLARERCGWRARWRNRSAVCTFFEEDDFFDALVVTTPPRTWNEIPFTDAIAPAAEAAASPSAVPDAVPDAVSATKKARSAAATLRRLFAAFPPLTVPPVTMLTLGFRRKDVAHPLDGFGMLVPEKEHRKILGTLFTSSLFPHRAPEGCVTLSTYLGGARQPEIAALDAEAQRALVLDELRGLLGVRGDPVFMERTENPHAIPQYELGYEKFLAAAEKIESAFPLFFAGNFRGGISVAQTMISALGTAARTADFLENSRPRHDAH